MMKGSGVSKHSISNGQPPLPSQSRFVMLLDTASSSSSPPPPYRAAATPSSHVLSFAKLKAHVTGAAFVSSRSSPSSCVTASLKSLRRKTQHGRGDGDCGGSKLRHVMSDSQEFDAMLRCDSVTIRLSLTPPLAQDKVNLDSLTLPKPSPPHSCSASIKSSLRINRLFARP